MPYAWLPNYTTKSRAWSKKPFRYNLCFNFRRTYYIERIHLESQIAVQAISLSGRLCFVRRLTSKIPARPVRPVRPDNFFRPSLSLRLLLEAV